MGTREYPPLAEKYRVPIVVTGFEPLDILEGIRRTVAAARGGPARGRERLPAGRAGRGQPRRRRRCSQDVFEVTDRTWRGIGDDPAQRLAAVASATPTSTPSSGSRSPTSTPRSRPICRSGRGAAGPDQAARVRGVRQGVHAAQPARRDDGVLRGRVRRLLPVPPARAGGDRLMPEGPRRPIDLDGLGLSRPAARLPDDRHGARRRRRDVGRADRAPVPAGVRRRGRRRAGRLRASCSTSAAARLAFSTDSFVVKPMFFPGRRRSATSPSTARSTTWRCRGRRRWSCPPRSSSRRAPRWPTSAGSPTAVGAAADAAGVQLVTGDTKVVDSGSGDGVFINTAGIGLVADGVDIRPERARARRRRARQRRHRRARRRGDELPRGPRVRHHGRERHRPAARPGRRRCWRPAPTSTCCATRPAAASRPRSTRSPGRAEVGIELVGARPADPARRRATPAACSGSTRCTSPTRASCSRSCPRDDAESGAGGDAGPPAGGAAHA